MDGSRVAQCLDSLWFFTNIFTCTRDDEPQPQPQPAPASFSLVAPSIRAKEKHESQNVENLILTPSCHKFEQMGAMVVPSRETKTKKRERRKRNKWNKMRLYGTNLAHGRLGFRFDIMFDVESWEYKIQQKTKMPPFEDHVAMKKHLKAWAYAVACTVR